jgi:hypothetical protein
MKLPRLLPINTVNFHLYLGKDLKSIQFTLYNITEWPTKLETNCDKSGFLTLTGQNNTITENLYGGPRLEDLGKVGLMFKAVNGDNKVEFKDGRPYSQQLNVLFHTYNLYTVDEMLFDDKFEI